MPYLTSPHAIENYLYHRKSAIILYFYKENERNANILKLAKSFKIMTKQVDKSFLKDLGAFHCALEVKEENFSGGFDWLKQKIHSYKNKKHSTVIFLDSITDPHNLGAILRSAALFNIDLVLYPQRRSAKGDSETVQRVSTGAASIIEHGEIPNILQCCELFKDAGFWIYAADMGGKDLRSQVKFAEKAMIIIGSEGKGISPSLKKTCDEIIAIPTNKKIDSLNASVAAGIIFYERFVQL
ncbi:MAG: 23S rRNA (guanosine(2251)-2'-O)-methyltransferase RlmB [Spirochaetia bacterium]